MSIPAGANNQPPPQNVQGQPAGQPAVQPHANAQVAPPANAQVAAAPAVGITPEQMQTQMANMASMMQSMRTHNLSFIITESLKSYGQYF